MTAALSRASIEEIIPQRVEAAQSWQLHVSGDLDLLPATARAALERVIQETADRPRPLALAIFPWQTRSAELYVVQHPWPGFSESDLDDALSYYATKRGRATK